MVTWTWTCLVCDASGNGDSYDAVIADAEEHNTQAGHVSPKMSYGNDAPPPPE